MGLVTVSLDIYLYAPCPHCGGKSSTEVFSANITHNLGTMADAADIYKPLWRPEENGIERAQQLIAALQRAISQMKANPVFYRQYDAPNGWGLYKNFMPWLERLLAACEENPDAYVEASR